MKRYALPLAFALAFTGATAFAQTADTQPPAPVVRHHAGNPHREATRLAKQLSLTPDQESKIEAIFADRDQKVAAAMNDTTLDQDARKEQIRAARKDSNMQVGALLTPDQRDQLKTIRQSHHHQEEPATAPPPSA
jgi:protein CpxP